MAKGLLDLENFDYNTMIDKTLGTTNQPFRQYIQDPNFGSSLNVDTGIGGIDGYLNSLYKGKSIPQKIMATLTGAKTARQAGINQGTTNLFNQQKFNENSLNLNKLTQDISLNQYKLSDAPMKSKKLAYETGTAGTTFRLGSLREKGIESKFRKLEEGGDLDLLQQYVVDPKAFDADQRKSDPRFRELSKLSVAEENVAKSLGMNLKDPTKNSEFQNNAFLDLINTPSDEVVATHNATEQRERLKDANYIPKEQKTLSQKLGVYTKQQKDGSNKTLSEQGKQTGLNNSPYRSRTFAPEEGYPSVKVNGKEIGGYVDYYGDKYTPEQWDKLGKQQQKALDPRLNADNVNKKMTAFETNGNDTGRAASYMMDTVSRSNKVIRRLMANPEAIKDMQSASGRFMINLKAGKYGFQTDGQDAHNLLLLIQNKEFIKQIQEMRNNNSTGGAVGNVSDREVQMFISAAAALQNTSSPDALYNEMLLLHRMGEDMVKKQSNKYLMNFGEEYYNNYDLGGSLKDANVGHIFPDTLKEALQKQRSETMNMDIGLGENLPAQSLFTATEIFEKE